jgi:hypothetical protein
LSPMGNITSGKPRHFFRGVGMKGWWNCPDIILNRHAPPLGAWHHES